MKIKPLFITALILLLLFVSACSQPVSPDNDKLIVAVSIVPQSTFVKKVAGDVIEVVTMIPPGSSAETYSPSPRQLQTFSNASIYFSIGVPSEEANILPKSKDFNKNLKIVDLASHVANTYPDIEVSPDERDPHIWLSPKRVKIMVDVIADELSLLDPSNKDTYIENAQAYKKQLDEVDDKIRESLSGLNTKTFIAYHPAFAYFAEDYGLEMISLEEDGKEATPKTFQKVIDIAKERDIKVIFYQEEVDSRQSETFAKEIGGTTEKIAPLSPDYIKNLEAMAETFSKVLK